MEGPKKEKKKKRCFLSFIRFAVDMGTVCCDLPPQSEAVCHHVAAEIKRKRGRLITRSLVSKK